MSNVNSIDNGTNVTNVSDQSQWDDSEHSKLVDFFRKHCSKVTEDVTNVGNDIKKGFEGIKKLAGDGCVIAEDFESSIKNEGVKTVVKDVIENTLGGKNPLDAIATPEQLATLKNDVVNLENIAGQLEKDGKPLEGDALIAAQYSKEIIGDVINLAQQGMAVYGGNFNPEEFGQIYSDLKDILHCLEAALQMNSSATQNGNSKNSGSSGVTSDAASDNYDQQVNTYLIDQFKTQQTDTDNQTQDKRHHHRHHHHGYERVNV